MNQYSNESIKQLKGADRVRKRPAVIFGSDDITGCQHSFFEILSNSIDEARAGYGKEIFITLHKDHSITVEDHARGIPVDYNKTEGRYNWELLFTELYAGAKYDTDDNAGLYKFSLGLNGLGLFATQCASEYMDVEVRRDGKLYELHFEKGEMTDGGFKSRDLEGPTGTKITWKPDLEVFKSIDIPLEYFKDICHKQAVVNPKISFILKDERTGLVSEYMYKKGISDYLAELTDGQKVISDIQYFESSSKGKDRADLPEYDVKIQVAYCFTRDLSIQKYFHNSSFLEYGGSPDRAVRLAFTYQLDKLAKELGKYNAREKKISYVDVADSLVFVSSTFSTESSYENQTKKAINNKFIQDFLNDEIRSKLEVFFIENRETAEKIVDQILVNKRSREKAETTRKNLKKTLSQKIDIANRVNKFIDCRTKDPSKKELYILEGDSALGSCKLARDSQFQALMPIRGKILNCLKADYVRIFKADIIMDLLKVFGAGVEISSKHNKDLKTFDLESLRWDKIIICTDADYDGFQIRGLVLAMLYRLVPTLIDEGKVYIAESPLYEIITPKGDSHFAYNESQKNKIVEDLNGKCSVHRSKGLGENDPEMMWHTTMSPDSRRLIRVMPTDSAETQRIFDVLLGDELESRKIFIEEHGHRYLEMMDLS